MTLGSLFDGSGGFPLGWRKVFKTYYTINGKKTVKTDKQIIKWLSSDNGDSAKYKMWGNGVALPNVIFVLFGIAEGSEDGNELLCSDEEINNSESDSYR